MEIIPRVDMTAGQTFIIRFPRITTIKSANETTGITAKWLTTSSTELSKMTSKQAINYTKTVATESLSTFALKKTYVSSGLTPLFNFTLMTSQNDLNGS